MNKMKSLRNWCWRNYTH